MIDLEYVNVQYQQGTTSYALKSQRRLRDQPVVTISKSNGKVSWEITGLKVGRQQTVSGAPRADRIDFYIGFEDLKRQRTTFPASTGSSGGLRLPLTDPTGTERDDGKTVKFTRSIGRIVIDDVYVSIPPFILDKNNRNQIFLNVDVERAFYKIKNQTTREIHFGIQHSYKVSPNENSDELIAKFEMNENQYAAVLEFINEAIDWYENN